MRRTLPLSFLILAFAFAAFVVSDTAEARHGRRRQQYCPSYISAPNGTVGTLSNVSCPKICPIYKMMGMGGAIYYYALEYDTDCSTSIPVSYDSSSSVKTGCACDAQNGTASDCCQPMITAPPPSVSARLRNSQPGDHVHHGGPPAGVQRRIDPQAPFEHTAKYNTEDLDKYQKEFLVEVPADGGSTFWALVARFNTTTGPTSIPLDVGFEVAKKSGVNVDVAASTTITITWTADGSWPKVGQLVIQGADPNYDGTYQILRAN